MTNGATTPPPTNRWQLFEQRFRRTAAIIGMATLVLIMMTIGPQFIYLLSCLGVAGAYIVFPDEIEGWFQRNEALMVGATIGFIYGNIPGLLVGGWLGQYLSRRFRQGSQIVQSAAEAVEPYIHPINYTQRQFNGIWQKCYQSYQWLMEEVDTEELQEAENEEVLNLDPIEAENDAQSESVHENVCDIVLREHPAPIVHHPILVELPENSISNQHVLLAPPTPVEPNEEPTETSRHSRLHRFFYGPRGVFPNGRAPSLI